MTTALNISQQAADLIKYDCLARMPNEACGFVVGPKGSHAGVRVVAMRNVHKEPERHYAMDPQDILQAYGEFDAKGEDVVAVYHSHPNGSAVLSEGGAGTDVGDAQDLTLAYMVVAVREDDVRARAYRIRTPFVGVRAVSEVPLHVSATGEPWAPAPPLLPWALSVGNRVRIRYTAHGVVNGFKEVTAIVTGSRFGEGDESRTVELEPAAKNGIHSIAIARIGSVEVLDEAVEGAMLRKTLVRCTRHVTAAVAANADYEGVQDLVAVLAAAFPPWIEASIAADAMTERGA